MGDMGIINRPRCLCFFFFYYSYTIWMFDSVWADGTRKEKAEYESMGWDGMAGQGRRFPTQTAIT